MQFTIDTDANTLTVEGEKLPLYSPQAFEILSHHWLKVGWNAHYHYTFTWMGRPILQLPEDILRLQEVIVHQKPDVIIETGVALGGSILFYASMCALMQKGRVIGIDIDLRAPNKKALETHPLAPYIHLIEGNSAAPETLKQVQQLITEQESVMVILDSNHSKTHVLKELELYAQLVTPGSYLVVADGFKQYLTDVPRGKKQWAEHNPAVAVQDFLRHHPEFVLEYPEKRYNRSDIRESVTHFQGGWLKKHAAPSKES